MCMNNMSDLVLCVFGGEKAPVESTHLRNVELDQRAFQPTATEFSRFLEPNTLQRKQSIEWELFCIQFLVSILGGTPELFMCWSQEFGAFPV